MALELEHQPLLLPAHHLVLDEAADLRAMLLHQRRRRPQDLLVDPVLDLAVGGERAAKRFQHRRDALVQRGGPPVVLGGEPGAQLVPKAAEIGGERRARERLVAQPMHPVAQPLVALQAAHEVGDIPVEAPAQLVAFALTHFADLLHRDLDDLQRRALVQLELEEIRQPFEERRALRHLPGEVGLRIGPRQQLVERPQRGIEQLVVAPVLREHIEQLGGGGRDIGVAQPAHDGLRQEIAHPLVIEGLQAIGSEPRHIGRHRFGVLGAQQPSIERTRRLEIADALHDRGARQKVALDEVRKSGGDARLVARGDRGMGNEAQAEGVMEERRHREPVGDRADHGRLGGHADVVEPGVARLQRLRRHVDATGKHQQSGGKPLHPRKARIARPRFCLFAHRTLHAIRGRSPKRAPSPN